MDKACEVAVAELRKRVFAVNVYEKDLSFLRAFARARHMSITRYIESIIELHVSEVRPLQQEHGPWQDWMKEYRNGK